jgi:hypothetical protein
MKPPGANTWHQKKLVDPSSFLPLWQHAPQSEKRREINELSHRPLDVILVNVLTSSSPAATCDYPGTTVVVVIEADTGVTLS